MSTNLTVIMDGVIYQSQSHGGISRMYSEILPPMCDLDESLRILMLTEGKLKKPLPQHALITRRQTFNGTLLLRPKRFWRSLVPITRRLTQRLSIGKGKNQIWHSTYYTRPAAWNGMQVVLVPDMIHERFAYLFNKPLDDLLRREKRTCVLQADSIICISETTRRDLIFFYGLDSKKIDVIHLACNDSFKPLTDLNIPLLTSIKKPFLLYVGDRAHYKNTDRLFEAYSRWPYREEIALVVVGMPWTNREKHRLAELAIRDRVYLHTRVNDMELCQLYNKAVALVYPSLYEGFGIPLLEAMACGCPIVASRIPTTMEVAGEDCPLYFEASQTESLITALDTVLTEGRTSSRVQVGFERVKHYSWKKAAEQLLTVYYALARRQ